MINYISLKEHDVPENQVWLKDMLSKPVKSQLEPRQEIRRSLFNTSKSTNKSVWDTYYSCTFGSEDPDTHMWNSVTRQDITFGTHILIDKSILYICIPTQFKK